MASFRFWMQVKRRLRSRPLLRIIIGAIILMLIFSIIIQWRASERRLQFEGFSRGAAHKIVNESRKAYPVDLRDDAAFSMRAQINRESPAFKASIKPIHILDWTGFFGQPITGNPDYDLSSCPHLNCILTNDTNMLDQSLAVVFHSRDISWADIPPTRKEWQYYVFFSLEPPAYENISVSEDKKYFFNLTMTYRHDSDVWVPYGSIQKREKSAGEKELNLSQIIKGKSRMAAWFASNCHTQSGREYYVKAMQHAGIKVDVYGSCSRDFRYSCPRNFQAVCNHILQKKYKFYLAFENSLCKDYVTEKFYDRIKNYVVPIVLERRNYDNVDFIPLKSYIAVDQYPTLDDLARHLMYLNEHNDEYAKYLRWHYDYEIKKCPPGGCAMCRLCKHLMQLSKRKYAKSKVVDIMKWWNAQSGCHTLPAEKLKELAYEPWIDFTHAGSAIIGIMLMFTAVLLVAVFLAFHCFN